MKKKEKASKPKRKKEKEPLLIQDLLSVKALEKGFFLTKDNRLVAVLKTGTVNKELLSKIENQALEEDYEALLKSFYFEYQELTVSQPLDNGELIEREKMKLERTKDFHRRKLINSYIDFLIKKGKSSNNMKRQRYFIFDEKLEAPTKEGLAEAIDFVRERANEVISGFKEIKLPAEVISGLEAVRLLQVFYDYESAQNNPIESLDETKIMTRRFEDGNPQKEAERETAATKAE